jgi:hypothetical protein
VVAAPVVAASTRIHDLPDEPPQQTDPLEDYGQEQMQQDADDDDDVDFNLGGQGASNGGMHMEAGSHGTSTAKNPSAKEDG